MPSVVGTTILATSAIRGANQLWTGVESKNPHTSAKGLLDVGAATAVGVAMLGPDAWAKGAAITAVGLMGSRAAYDILSPDQKLSGAERTSKFLQTTSQFGGGLGASSVAWSQSPIALPQNVARPLAVVGGTIGLAQAVGELGEGAKDKVATIGKLAGGTLSVAAGLTGSPTLGVATVLVGAGVTAWSTLGEAQQLGDRVVNHFKKS